MPQLIPKYLAVPPGVEPDPRNVCDMCGKPAFELRPFGPNAESICEECSKKDPELTERRHACADVREAIALQAADREKGVQEMAAFAERAKADADAQNAERAYVQQMMKNG